eukprot:751105-Hanusia_phi.AAC.1
MRNVEILGLVVLPQRGLIPLNTCSAPMYSTDNRIQGFEWHFVPSLQCYIYQEAKHHLPTRREQRGRVRAADSRGVLMNPGSTRREVFTYIAKVLPDSPLLQAALREGRSSESAPGIRVKDRIVEVNGRDVRRSEWPELMDMIEGSVADVIVLT